MTRSKPGPKRKEGSRYPCGKLRPIEDPRPTPEQQEMRRKLYGAPQANGELLYDPLNRIAWLSADQRDALMMYRGQWQQFRLSLPPVHKLHSHLAGLHRQGGEPPSDDRLNAIERAWKDANFAVDRDPNSPIRRAVRDVCLDFQPATGTARHDGNDLLRAGADRLVKHYGHWLAIARPRAFGPPAESYERGGTEDAA